MASFTVQYAPFCALIQPILQDIDYQRRRALYICVPIKTKDCLLMQAVSIIGGNCIQNHGLSVK